MDNHASCNAPQCLLNEDNLLRAARFIQQKNLQIEVLTRERNELRSVVSYYGHDLLLERRHTRSLRRQIAGLGPPHIPPPIPAVSPATTDTG